MFASATRYAIGSVVLLASAAGVSTGLGVAPVSAIGATVAQASPMNRPTVAEALAATPELSTLKAAVEAAGLVDALEGAPAVTIFAPTNAAFDALGAEAVAGLLKPEKRARLTAVLTYHAVPAALEAGDLLGRRSVDTLNGLRARVSLRDGQLAINESSVIVTNVPIRNGVVHVIDRVLVPTKRTLVQTLDGAGHFDLLLSAAAKVGLDDFLGEPGPYTILAPTDEAFEKLPAGTLESLLAPSSREQLLAILKLHVVPGRIYADRAAAAASAPSLAGEDLRFSLEGGRLTVNGARIVRPDLEAANGVVHAIDRVLLPNASPSAGAPASSATPPMMAVAAIDRGVPLFNAGDHGACAAIYRATLEELAQDMRLSPALRDQLRRAMAKADHASKKSEQAWILRGGLDAVLEEMPAPAMPPARTTADRR